MNSFGAQPNANAGGNSSETMIMILNIVLGVIGLLSSVGLLLSTAIVFYVIKKAKEKRIKNLEKSLNRNN